MRRILSFFLVLALGCTVASAQKKAKQAELPQEPEKTFVQKAREAYTNFYDGGGVFEKLYLMTDKPYYSAGETIYFSGFLVQATMLTRISASEFIYVELIGPDGRLVERKKICAEQKQFIGNFNLTARLTSGKYTLRAYSMWMTNFDLGYFYTKQIYVGNYIDDAVMTNVDYQINEDGTIVATVRFSDQYAIPIASNPVKYRTIIDNKSKSGSARTDKDGKIQIKFKPSDNPNDCFELNMRANSRELSRTIQMPTFTQDYDVQFCPESGNLIAGLIQVIAFKAQASNGHSISVSGKLYDESGNFLSDISTEHNGMGRFIMRAIAGHKYYAEFESAEGLKKRFELPAPSPSGIAVRVMRQVAGHMFIIQATPDINIKDYAAVIHSRGAVMTVLEDISHPLNVRNCDMFDGIGQISIVNKISKMVVAERLFYVRDNRFAKTEFTFSKPQYEQRDKVVMTMEVKGSDGKPAQGNFALSVTDANVVKYSPSDQNIFSYMLLSSDLKGDVEDAASYFSDDTPARLEKLDLVMLTNGWRRYNLQDILNGVMPRIIYPMEDSQRIMGSVFGLFGKAKKPSVVVMNPKTKFVQQFELNESNNFIISGLDAFSTATYIVQALNKKGKDNSVRIKIESENYPVLVTDYKREYYKDRVNIIPETFLTRAKERYFNEGGERVIDIEEIVVVAKKRQTPFFAAGNTGSMLNGDLSRFGSVYDALATFKELEVTGRTITTLPKYVSHGLAMNQASISVDGVDNDAIGDNSSDVSVIQIADFADNDARIPELYINGNISDIEAIDSYDMKYVERLAFVDGKAAYMLGLSAPSGAILMEVSAEGLSMATTSESMARVIVRACNKPDEFFHPKYPTPADRTGGNQDMRSTITWEPFIRTDALGQATVGFYTADRSGKYDVVLEGITDAGELCRSTAEIDVKFKPLM